MFSSVKCWLFKKSKQINLEDELRKMRSKVNNNNNNNNKGETKENEINLVQTKETSTPERENNNNKEFDDRVDKLKKEIQLIRLMYKEEQQTNLVGLDSLTIHGLPRVFSTPAGILKLCWFLLFLISVFALGIYVLKSWDRFLRKPTGTISSKAFKQLAFPTITICNMRENAKNTTQFPTNSTLSAKDLLQQALLRSTTLRPVSFGDFSDGMNIIVSRFDNYCMFGSRGKKCGTPYWKSLGFGRRCVVFNADGNLTQADIGKKEGLQLMLYINSNHYLLVTQTENVMNYPMEGEILVSIHEPNTMPDLWNNVFYLELGFIHQIQLDRTIRTRIKDCARKYPTPGVPGNYVHTLCLSYCNIEKMYSRCGEVPPRFREFLGYDVLPNIQYPGVNTSQCLEDVANEISFADSMRQCGCDLACNSTFYTSSKFSSSWFSNEKMMVLESTLKREAGLDFTESDIRRNFTILNVYYNSYLTSLETEEFTYDVSALCSDVGGMMGLFCGASAFSIVELVFVFIISVLTLPMRLWRKCCTRHSKIDVKIKD